MRPGERAAIKALVQLMPDQGRVPDTHVCMCSAGPVCLRELELPAPVARIDDGTFRGVLLGPVPVIRGAAAAPIALSGQ